MAISTLIEALENRIEKNMVAVVVAVVVPVLDIQFGQREREREREYRAGKINQTFGNQTILRVIRESYS